MHVSKSIFCVYPTCIHPTSVSISIYRIAAVTEQSRDLMTVIGDVGDEYRG